MQGISIETFSAFPHDKLDDTWIMVPAQEAHAKTILESSTNLRDIRFKLCPSQLRDEVTVSRTWLACTVCTPQPRGVCSRTQTTAGSHATHSEHAWNTRSSAVICTIYSELLHLSEDSEQRAVTMLARTSSSYCCANVNTLTHSRSVLIQDFWQIYFIVTQKDGVEAVEQQSLGSSWGTCPSYTMGIVSSDENEAGFSHLFPPHALVPGHPHLLTAHVSEDLGRRYTQHRVCLLSEICMMKYV